MQLQDVKKAYLEAKGAHDQLPGLREEREHLFDEGEKVGDLDAKIDYLEHQSEHLEDLRHTLISEIRKRHPEAPALDRWGGEEQKIAAQLDELAPLRRALDEGAEAKKIKGFWGFLWGRNPSVIIASAVRKAIDEAEKLKQQKQGAEIDAFLDRFLEEAHKKWNGTLYTSRFYALHAQFCALLERLEEEKRKSSAETLQIEEEIERWIEMLT